jgi:hypothetical protein
MTFGKKIGMMRLRLHLAHISLFVFNIIGLNQRFRIHMILLHIVHMTMNKYM